MLLTVTLVMAACTSKNDSATVEVSVEQISNDKITDEQALAAVKNYCYEMMPDLKDMEESGEYTIYFEVVSSDDKEIVVLFRSYTAAEIRYYIDAATGDTHVTEFVPGITDKEEETDEKFNIKDYYER